jgi:hypothetical protein
MLRATARRWISLVPSKVVPASASLMWMRPLLEPADVKQYRFAFDEKTPTFGAGYGM